jgi:hypothetical protein
MDWDVTLLRHAGRSYGSVYILGIWWAIEETRAPPPLSLSLQLLDPRLENAGKQRNTCRPSATVAQTAGAAGGTGNELIYSLGKTRAWLYLGSRAG